jgi:hypothetical protein
MSDNIFYIRLLLVSAGVAATLALLHVLVPATQMHLAFSATSLLLFVLLTTLLFYAGKNASKSKNKLAFNNLISVSVFGKMAVALGFLFFYQHVAQPANTWFVAIFLICYVAYTSFEVWFMTLLAKR